MTPLTKEARDKVVQAKNLLFEALETAANSNGDYSFDTQEDQLRFYMFLHDMADAAKGISSLASVCEVTDEDLRQMCAESKVTMSEAICRARMNFMVEAFNNVCNAIRRCDT